MAIDKHAKRESLIRAREGTLALIVTRIARDAYGGSGWSIAEARAGSRLRHKPLKIRWLVVHPIRWFTLGSKRGQLFAQTSFGIAGKRMPGSTGLVPGHCFPGFQDALN